MTQYLVYRHGSNGANQSMQQVKPLCIVEARNKSEARDIAESSHTFYANQHSVAVPKSRVSNRDWEFVVCSDGMANLDDCLPLENGVIATNEPKIDH